MPDYHKLEDLVQMKAKDFHRALKNNQTMLVSFFSKYDKETRELANYFGRSASNIKAIYRGFVMANIDAKVYPSIAKKYLKAGQFLKFFYEGEPVDYIGGYHEIEILN